MVKAENALIHQSGEHPDGWGVAYYIAGSPHIVKSADTAFEDSLFQRLSGVVSSETVLAHIRRATVGGHSIINAHPFQFGKWTFAHNGNIKDFNKHREKLIAKISPHYKRFILGETDSEVLFFLILTHLSHRFELHHADFSVGDLAEALECAVDEVISVVGNYLDDDSGPPEETYLTFLLSNGEAMIAHHGGKDLYFSTYKTACGEKDTCPSFAHECLNPTKNGHVSHLIFSSEPLDGENVWHRMTGGEMIGVDWRMRVWFSDVTRYEPEVVERRALKIIKS